MLLILLFGASSTFLGVLCSRGEIDSQNECINCFNVDFDNTVWLKQNEDGSNQKQNLGRHKIVNEDLFGFSLALGEDRVYIGAPGYNIAGTLFQCPISRGTSENTLPCYDTKSNEDTRRLGKYVTCETYKN